MHTEEVHHDPGDGDIAGNHWRCSPRYLAAARRKWRLQSSHSLSSICHSQ
jgi:hypothetical protein